MVSPGVEIRCLLVALAICFHPGARIVASAPASALPEPAVSLETDTIRIGLDPARNGAIIPPGIKTPISCQWLEDYGERRSFPAGEEGLRQAHAALEALAHTGRVGGPRSAHGPGPKTERPQLEVYTRGFVVDLANLGEQRKIVARFPVFRNGQWLQTLAMTHWTNHPDWVTRQWREEQRGDESGETLTWYCLEFRVEPSKAKSEGYGIGQGPPPPSAGQRGPAAARGSSQPREAVVYVYERTGAETERQPTHPDRRN